MELDLGDEVTGWAVFNRGTPDARLEQIDELQKFDSDEDAVNYCIDRCHTDPKCLLALCATYATDPIVRGCVDNNLMVG